MLTTECVLITIENEIYHSSDCVCFNRNQQLDWGYTDCDYSSECVKFTAHEEIVLILNLCLFSPFIYMILRKKNNTEIKVANTFALLSVCFSLCLDFTNFPLCCFNVVASIPFQASAIPTMCLKVMFDFTSDKVFIVCDVFMACTSHN